SGPARRGSHRTEGFPSDRALSTPAEAASFELLGQHCQRIVAVQRTDHDALGQAVPQCQQGQGLAFGAGARPVGPDLGTVGPAAPASRAARPPLPPPRGAPSRGGSAAVARRTAPRSRPPRPPGAGTGGGGRAPPPPPRRRRGGGGGGGYIPKATTNYPRLFVFC